MRLSIVIPLLNEAAGLPRFLAHLRTRVEAMAGSELGVDVLLVDGGSDDGTHQALRDAGFACITAERGRGSQMNAGAAATRGDVILFLHADTRLPPDALQQAGKAIGRGCVGGFFRVRLDSRRPLLRLIGHLITRRSSLTGIATGDQAIFVARSAFESLGGYAPLPLFEDVELSRRLKRLGSVARIEATVTTSARRWEQRGPWRTILRMWLLRLMYLCGVEPARLARYHETAR